MSLKDFHTVFIIFSILSAVGFGYWGIHNYAQAQTFAYLGAAIASFGAAFGLVIYEISFLKKVKEWS